MRNDALILERKHIARIGNELAKATIKAEEHKLEIQYGKTCRKVLTELLAHVEYLNFREKAKLGDGDKITRKLYVVITIDEILQIATNNNWGLCTKDGFIYVFNGRFWQAIGDEDFKPFLAEAAMKMGVPNLDAKYHQFKEELYKQFLSASNLPTPEPSNKVLINLRNGTFEISSDKQELREPNREDFIKYQLPFEYNPQASCPLFDNYLGRVLPDKDCQKVLAEYIGYVFINNLKLEKALILYGSGANGKSVFFEIISALVGRENISSYSLQSLTKIDGYHRAELANKLLNYASEINGKLETSIFKQLVSGEPVEARQIYGKPFIMERYGKLIFNCNELPREVEQTDAFFRRFLIIPFDQTIPEDEQDSELASKIINNELSGVFNWVLEGLRRLLEQRKFTQAKAVKEQISQYQKESNSVAMFLEDERYSPSLHTGKTLSELNAEYRSYCYSGGYMPYSISNLSKRLKNMGFNIERKSAGNFVYVEQK